MAKATSTTRPRTPRKPARAAKDGQGTSRARKPATGWQTAKGTGPTRPNPFDDIARQVNADQEAKDREVGRDDLTPALAKSVDQAKAKRSGTSRAATKPAKPARPAKPATPAKPVKPTVPTKVQANGKPTTTFKGRPTGNVQTVAARVKELNLRVRSDADIDALATRLRAVPAAVAEWLASRNGKQPAKATARQPAAKIKETVAERKAKLAAKAKSEDKPKSEFLTGITLHHPWTDRKPDYLKGRTLVTRYQVKVDGTVWATLTQLRESDGTLVPNFKDYPLDYRPTQERDGRNRPVILKGDLEGPALRDWLLKQGIASPRDIETSV
jgi:hypothetical protein